MSLLVATAPPPTRRGRLRAPALTIGALALATVALRLRDPHVDGSWGLCPSAAMGFWCPGCGGLRAVNDLTHGDVAAAASSNLLLVVLVPLVVLALGAWSIGRWRASTWQPSDRLLYAGVGVVVTAALVFGVLRNTSVGGWLAP